MKIGDVIHGFELKEERDLPEISSMGRKFHHVKSGAELVHLASGDDNKVFAITFRTPPRDSTGLPHILEHSVLCGSRKFPTKEPFVELAKGSLNTFLNAFTFPDKTMYPVASRNPRDLFNLMDVYLDAVFFPRIYGTPEILMQEGWHHELDGVDKEVEYKGVVYNEMRGAFSSPDSILERAILNSLFPDNCYGLESGGDPEQIPNLSQKQFEEFHRAYYHASNARVFLYGDGDPAEQLAFLDREYLSKFAAIQVDSGIPLQSGFAAPRQQDLHYPLAADERESQKAFLSLNFVTGQTADSETVLLLEVLEELLLETPAAPLKKALLEAGIGRDVFGSFDSGVRQPTFSIIAKHCEAERAAEFESRIWACLEGLVRDGIDKELIEGCVNRKEFRLREGEYRQYPKGLVYCIRSMESWLYDADPFVHLTFDSSLEKARTGLKSRLFEDLISRYLIGNRHRSLVRVLPEKGLAEKREAEIRKKLDGFQSGLCNEDVTRLVEKTKELQLRQATPDTDDQLKRIPVLSLSDIGKTADELPLEEKSEKGNTVFHHALETNRICYWNLHFQLDRMPPVLWPYIPLLSSVLGKLDTQKRDYASLSNQIGIYTGGIGFASELFTNIDDPADLYPKFRVKSKSFLKNLPQLADLLAEILTETRYENEVRLGEILGESKSRMEAQILSGGHQFVVSRLLSYFSRGGAWREAMHGLTHYKFLAELVKGLPGNAGEILENLRKAAQHVFSPSNLIHSVTVDPNEYSAFPERMNQFSRRLFPENHEGETFFPEPAGRNEGLLTSAKIQYVSKGGDFRTSGHSYSGALRVLHTIARYDYLWNRVRVLGGAYGCFADFGRNGDAYLCSYRDPNLKKTVEVFDEAGNYFRQFSPGEREMRKYLIGTVRSLDAPLTPSMKGEIATTRRFRRQTQEMIQQERDEVLSTTPESIRKLGDLLDDVMRQGHLCVMGNESKIKEDRALFSDLINAID